VTEQTFSDLPVLEELGARLTAAFAEAERVERSVPPRRRGFWLRRRWLGVALAALLVGGGAATATKLVIHEGSPIKPAPAADFGPKHGNMVPPLSGTGRIVATVPDPKGGLPWGLRVSRAANGQPCTGTGQVYRGQLGLVDDGGVFHRLPLRGPDNCNPAPKRDEVYWGMQGRATPKAGAGQLVVSGLAGSEVTNVVVIGTQTRRAMKPVRPSGGFLAVVPGTASAYDVDVVASFRDGSQQTFAGRAPRAPRFEVTPAPVDRLGDVTVRFRAPFPADDPRDRYRVALFNPRRGCDAGLRNGITTVDAPQSRNVELLLAPGSITKGAKSWCPGRFKATLQFLDYMPGAPCKPADDRAGLCSRERPVGRFFTFLVR
jgi:hypothetical protein